MDVLIGLLELIDEDENLVQFSKHPLVDAVKYLCEELLMDDEGPGKIQKLIKKGYNIYPCEQDRFGWLCARIEMKRGVILFG